MNVDITGARIYFTIPIFGGIPITATIVNSLLVTLIIIGLSIFLTLSLIHISEPTRQAEISYAVFCLKKKKNKKKKKQYS